MRKNMLERYMVQNGYSVTNISRKLRCTPATLLNKLNGKSQFTLWELQKLKKILHLNMEDVEILFFSNNN